MESTCDVNIKYIQNFLRLQYAVLKIASEILRVRFCEKWKSIYNSEWTNVTGNGKLFIEGVGKNLYRLSKNIQKNYLKSGNVNLWDLPLIIESIKCLESFIKSCKNHDIDDEHKKMDNLKTIRNQLSHQPSTEVTDENFEKYWNATCEILLSFGVSQQILDEAKNLKFTESTAFTDSFTRTDDSNCLKANDLKQTGNKYHAAKKYQEAIDTYSEAIELPGIPLKTLAILYSNRSLMHLELNDLPNAKDDAKGVIHMNPTWWRGYARLADSYEKMKKYEKAIKNYEIALQMNPSPDIHQKTLTESLYYCRRMLGKINRMDSIQPHNYINSMKEAFDETNKQLGIIASPVDELQAYIGRLLIDKSDPSCSDPAIACAQGHQFIRGIGGSQDFESAASRFAKAASKGSADGMYNLGVLLLEGKGIKRDSGIGLNMLKQAAAQPSLIFHGEKKIKLKNEGVSEAKHALGLAYYEGSGVPKNIKTAFEWWSRAVEEDGNGASANNIGIMYEEGELVTPDIEKAILYWKFGAFDDLVRAMVNLYRVSINRRRNFIDGFNWYQLSIENGSVKDTQMEEIISRNRFGKFDSKSFVEKLKNELKKSQFRNIVLQCEEIKKNMAQMIEGNRRTLITDQIVHSVPETNDAVIVEHRTWVNQMSNLRGVHGQAITTFFAHPAKLKGKPNLDVIGLKEIYFLDMPVDVEKIYEGYGIKVLIIDDAIVGQPSVNVIGQDNRGTIQRIFIYNIPQNEETQDSVGYGCTITIVNPYHKTGATDRRPMIRVDDPSTIIYHRTLTNKKRCRYCGDPQGKITCKKCQCVYYCSQKCLKKDSDDRQHNLVCFKKL